MRRRNKLKVGCEKEVKERKKERIKFFQKKRITYVWFHSCTLKLEH
jgi:hypothetical protein